MNNLREIGKTMARRYARSRSMEDWIAFTQKNLVLPFYHLVSDQSPTYARGLYRVKSIDEFKRDLDFYQTHFTAVDMDELIKTKGVFAKPSFHLSFDDGLREVCDIVAPILIERKIPASFFINTDFLDNKDLLYRFKARLLDDVNPRLGAMTINWLQRDQLDSWASDLGISFSKYAFEERPYLSSAEIKEMVKLGFSIGAHSLNHPRYHLLSLEDQLRQTQVSLDLVQELTGTSNRIFSFPFTDYGVSIRFFELMRDSVDLTFGAAGVKDDSAPNHLQRLPMEIKGSADAIVRESYAYYALLSKVGRNRILRS